MWVWVWCKVVGVSASVRGRGWRRVCERGHAWESVRKVGLGGVCVQAYVLGTSAEHAAIGLRIAPNASGAP